MKKASSPTGATAAVTRERTNVALLEHANVVAEARIKPYYRGALLEYQRRGPPHTCVPQWGFPSESRSDDLLCCGHESEALKRDQHIEHNSACPVLYSTLLWPRPVTKS